jgi:hypothetical protein
MMAMALRMGRTLSELSRSMTASELQLWMEFDRISPIGDVRGDIQAAQVASAVFNSQGCKTTLQDVLLRWQQDEAEAEAEQGDPFAKLEAALMAAAKK